MKISKNLKKVLVSLLFLIPVYSSAGTIEGDIVSSAAASVDFVKTIDMKGVEKLSLQAVYSDGTPAGNTFSSGARSTGSITVSNFASLVEKKAQVSITVSSNSTQALTGAVITINNAPFRQGTEWSIGASTLATTQSISNAINSHAGLQSTHTAAGIITASASVAGSFANAFAVTSSTPTALILTAATLTGGQDNATIQFSTSGVILTQGTDWNAVTSNAITAENIENAIQANATLAAIITATHPAAGSVVFATVTINGEVTVPISVSSPTALTLANKIGLLGGTTSGISVPDNLITVSVASNTFQTGMKVLFSTTAGATPPGGLTNQTTYFAIRINDTSYKLATSSTNAVAGTAIDITSLPVTNSVYTLTPPAFSVAPNNGFFWKASNDGINFSSFNYYGGTSVSSVTYSSAGNTLWDFQWFGYRYLQFVFTGPTNGGIAVRVRQYGKDN